MDYGTGWTYADPLPSRSKESVILMLRKIINMHGKPISILTDNGEEFMSYLVQNFLRRLLITHLRMTPYHPQTNGCLEHFNYEIEEMLMCYCTPNSQHLWDTYIEDALLAHRAHVNHHSGTSAFYLAYGSTPHLPHDFIADTISNPPTDEEIEQLQSERLEHVQDLERLHAEVNERAHIRLAQQAECRDERYCERALGIEDLILRRSEPDSKIHPRWDGPFIIQDVTDKNTYQLATRNGYILRRLCNGERLKRYHPATIDPEASLWYASADLQRKDANERLKADLVRRRGQQ
ncbi:hypothetical protein SCP_0509190 [Sparassis crispa]|uniref:Integrase catalytic domain-containing protein n=1 Tax=Sparassis crispa TaxID=139825 RepID=A0A401GNT4_9APHY|nr:hypothetical protein SCP_0509190 [Sparassis crispa]GBE83862.1 hypothetical protein SCP_0509190 [Sparassis crispa]